MVTDNKRFSVSDDGDLQRRVVSYLTHQNMRTLRAVDVVANDGTVVLSGKVDSFYEKQLCLNCCRRVAGVVELVDEICVG